MDERKAYWFEQPYMPRMKNIAVAPVILEGDDYIYESIGHLVGWCFFRGEMEVAGCIWYRMGF